MDSESRRTFYFYYENLRIPPTSWVPNNVLTLRQRRHFISNPNKKRTSVKTGLIYNQLEIETLGFPTIDQTICFIDPEIIGTSLTNMEVSFSCLIWSFSRESEDECNEIILLKVLSLWIISFFSVSGSFFWSTLRPQT